MIAGIIGAVLTLAIAVLLFVVYSLGIDILSVKVWIEHETGRELPDAEELKKYRDEVIGRD